MARIVVAVSGGADSLYALLSLQEAGHEVVALHGLFLPDATSHTAHESKENMATLPEGIDALDKLCQKRNIPFHICNLRKAFDQAVITTFVQDYASGRTPNPCALCNKHIKFGLLMDAALELGAEYFATGHYATLRTLSSTQSAKSPLSKAQDAGKDQSYFLSLVPKERFAKVLFPLAQTQKSANKAFLQDRQIAIPIAKESQEICFVPADAYRDFMLTGAQQRRIKLGKPGPIFIREDGQEILLPKKYGGEHVGLWQYTEGQRRGLGVAWKEPLYVCAKDDERNALILGNKSEATLQGCLVEKMNFLVAYDHWPKQVFVRVRYRQQEAPALCVLEAQNLRITFSQSQTPTAPGQIAAIYDATGNILAGGIISATF